MMPLVHRQSGFSLMCYQLWVSQERETRHSSLVQAASSQLTRKVDFWTCVYPSSSHEEACHVLTLRPLSILICFRLWAAFTSSGSFFSLVIIHDLFHQDFSMRPVKPCSFLSEPGSLRPSTPSSQPHSHFSVCNITQGFHTFVPSSKPVISPAARPHRTGPLPTDLAFLLLPLHLCVPGWNLTLLTLRFICSNVSVMHTDIL